MRSISNDRNWVLTGIGQISYSKIRITNIYEPTQKRGLRTEHIWPQDHIMDFHIMDFPHDSVCVFVCVCVCVSECVRERENSILRELECVRPCVRKRERERETDRERETS